MRLVTKVRTFSIVLYFPYIRNSNRLETHEAYGNLQGRRKRPSRFNAILLRFSYHFFQLQGAIWAAAAGEDYRVATLPSGEPVIATMNLAIDNLDLAVSAENLPAFRPVTDGISAYELWQVQKLKRGLRQEYLDHWNATVELTGTGRPVDAILSPCAPYVAPPHGTNKCDFSHYFWVVQWQTWAYFSFHRDANYTIVWNGLDYTALVLPTGLSVDPVLDAKKPAHAFYNDLDKTNYDFCTENLSLSSSYSYLLLPIYADDPETFKDAPICIQLIGKTLEEEAVIAMGEIVDSALKAKVVPSKL